MFYRRDELSDDSRIRGELRDMEDKYKDAAYTVKEYEREINRLNNKPRGFTLYELKQLDTSFDLPEDVSAKLQLLHGDFIVVPIGKLEK